MRLIDFDKLIELYGHYFGNYTINELKEIREDNIPFIEAIPVEWIENYLIQYTDMAGEYLGKDDDIAMYGLIRLNIISELLSAWKRKDDPLEIFPYVKGYGWKRVVMEKENE